MTYTKTTFVEGSAPGISAIELNKLGDGIANSAQPDIDNAFSVAQTIQVVGDTIGMILGFGGSGNYQIRTNDNGADAQQNATLPSWAFALQEGASDNVTFYRKPAGGAIAQLFRLDNAGQLYLVDGTKTVWHLGNLQAPAQTNVDNAFSAEQTFSGQSAIQGHFLGLNRRPSDGHIFDSSSGAIQFNIDTASNQLFGQVYSSIGSQLPDFMDIDLSTGKVKIQQGIDTANNGQYLQMQLNGPILSVQDSAVGGGYKPVGGYTSSRKGSYNLLNGTTGTILSLSGAGQLEAFKYMAVSTGSGIATFDVTIDGVLYGSFSISPSVTNFYYVNTFLESVVDGSSSQYFLNLMLNFESSLVIACSANSSNQNFNIYYSYCSA